MREEDREVATKIAYLDDGIEGYEKTIAINYFLVGIAHERKRLLGDAKLGYVDAHGLSMLRYPCGFYECLAVYAKRPNESPGWIAVKLVVVDEINETGGE